MNELIFRPDRSLSEPVYQQLAGYLRSLIESDRLKPGEKLPASRELAAALSLSRNTINQAYQTLLDQQLVYAHVGQGTFVADLPTPREPSENGNEANREFVWESLYSTRARSLPHEARRMRQIPQTRFDFQPGSVDTTSLPTSELTRAYRRAIGRDLPSLANLLTPLGWTPLREAIARNLVTRGIHCQPGDIMITNGAQQALDLLSRMLIDPGDTVVIEQPGYFAATVAFQAAQADVVGVCVDDEGLETGRLEQVMHRRRVKLVYTTPAVQSPTGVLMSESRRHSLLALAERYQTPILEDDYDGELRLDTPAVGALKTLDRAGQVVYVGTFSKAVFPGIRLGYIVGAQPLLEKLSTAKATTDLGTSLLDQAALTELFTSGGLERHIRKVRKIYNERIDIAVETLGDSLPEDARYRPPAGGNSLWINLPPGTDRDALKQAFRKAGLRVPSGDPFYLEPPPNPSLYLSVANMEKDELREGLTLLAECVWQALRHN